MIALQTAFTVDLESDGLLMEIMALPGSRAAAIVSRPNGSWSLALVDGDRTVSWNPIDGASDAQRQGENTTLCPMGEGFALVSGARVMRWKSFGAAPQSFVRVDPFLSNQHGYKVGIWRGGLSDDPDAALVLLHEPQMMHEATRYALLRLHEPTETARWEWTDAAGDPPFLAKEDFPIPDFWRVGNHFADIRPFLDHGSWVGGRLRLFALGGLTSNFVRWGMDYSIDATVEGRCVVARWVSDEPSWGRYTSSGRRLLLRPLRASGRRKKVCRLLKLETGEVQPIALPPGLAEYIPIDERAGTFWLAPASGAAQLVACVFENV